MKRDLLDAAYKLETAKSLDLCWQVVVDTMAAQTLDLVFYIVRDDGTLPNWFVLSNLPKAWPKQETRKPEFKEPFVTYCCGTFEPTQLGVEFIDQHIGYIDAETRSYINSMAQRGWTAGLGFPCCLIGSGQHGGFVVGNGMNRFDFERAVVPLTDQLRTFSLIAHRRIEAWREDKSPTKQRLPLSAREFQVLDLIAKGQRPKAIATQLGLGESSIRLYIKNARLKLGAATKEEALMRFVQERQTH